MSPLQKHDRLREICLEIEKLDAQLIELERSANGLVGMTDGNQVGRAEAEVYMTRLKLDQLLREHMSVASDLLKASCPIHGPRSLVVTCPDCCEAWGHARRSA